MIELFLNDLNAEQNVQDAAFLVDRVPWLHAALHRFELRAKHDAFGKRISNVSFKNPNAERSSSTTTSAMRNPKSS